MSIKRLGKDRYFLYTVDYRGRKVRLRFDRREDAEALQDKIRQEKYEKKLVGVGLRKARHSIKECLEDYRATKALLRPKSVQKYTAIIKQFGHYCEKMSIKYIDEFSPEYATLFYNELVKEITLIKNGKEEVVRSAPKTINFYIQTVKGFFQEEVIKDHLMKSPMLHVKNVKVSNKKPDFYTIEELNKIFSQEMSPEYRKFFLGLLYSGMRFSEAANLTWDYVDFEQSKIYIRAPKGKHLKTENAERDIKIPKVLLNLLIEMQKSKKSDLVFCTSSGTQIKERKALMICKEVAESAGVSSRAFLHKFRATYATILVRSKVSLDTIKELLGHSSVTITEKAYANNDSAGDRADISILNDIIK